MENDIIPTISTEPKATDRDSRLNAGNRPDEKEKDDGVKLPERDLVMNRPQSGQAPNPSETQRSDEISSEVNH